MVPELEDLTYKERLKALIALEERRERNLIQYINMNNLRENR